MTKFTIHKRAIHWHLVHSQCRCSHHHHLSPERFSSSQTETLYPFDTNLLPSAPGNHHSTFCLHACDYSGDLIRTQFVISNLSSCQRWFFSHQWSINQQSINPLWVNEGRRHHKAHTLYSGHKSNSPVKEFVLCKNTKLRWVCKFVSDAVTCFPQTAFGSVLPQGKYRLEVGCRKLQTADVSQCLNPTVLGRQNKQA